MKVLVLGDFNAEMLNSHMEEFCSVYKLEKPCLGRGQ